MKGIILAGGTGSRLYPITKTVSKQLLAIYDKPMINYPLSVLMLAGITEILIISTPHDLPSFKNLFEDGANLGLKLSYAEQPNPDGLAQAFIIGEDFIGDSNVALALGDNIFYGQHFSDHLIAASSKKSGASIFGYHVKDPERFGVVEFNNNEAVSIEEKPTVPKSNFAITGIYFYPNSVIKVTKSIKPSERNELEITSVNNSYLDSGKLKVEVLERGFAWLDTGTPNSLIEAGQFVYIVEQRQGYKIACLEEIAYRNGWLTKMQLKSLAEPLIKSGYGQYLIDLLSE